MLNKFLISSALSLCLLSVATDKAFAQECRAPYEISTRLFHPDAGAYMVWEGLYGKPDKQEKLTSALSLKGGGAIAVGEVRANVGALPDLVLAQFDQRGRLVWEKNHKISGFVRAGKVFPTPKGYMIAAQYQPVKGRAAIWLGFFSPAGEKISSSLVDEAGGGLVLTDIIPAASGSGWVVSATLTKGGDEKNAVIYLLDPRGNKIMKREYDLGAGGEIMGLSVSKNEAKESGYIATGYFVNDFGKKIGWVIRLEKDLSLVWQREFDRGVGAAMHYATPLDKNNILISGDILPVDGGRGGSILMSLDADTGNVAWQRYYSDKTAHHDVMASGLGVTQDGLITLAMNMTVPEKVKTAQDKAGDASTLDRTIPENSDYVYVLALSPRGVGIGGDAYSHGQGGGLSQMVLMPDGRRLMVGSAMASPTEVFGLGSADLQNSGGQGGVSVKKEGANQSKMDDSSYAQSGDNKGAKALVSRDGWVFIGDKPQAYTDPCRDE